MVVWFASEAIHCVKQLTPETGFQKTWQENVAIELHI